MTTPSTSADAAHARWRALRAPGRTYFIWRHGVLGMGMPVALLAILYRVIQEQGWVWNPHLTDSLRNAIGVAFVVFPMCGWIFGKFLWDSGEARYHERPAPDE